LLARNLGLGIDDVDAALRLALTGRNRTVDVGYIRLDPADEVGDLGPDRGPVPESATDATVVTGTATSTGTAPTTYASAAADTAPTTGTAAGPADGHVFLVMAGLGLDATIMAETSEEAKARRGQHAYVATGLRNFLGPRFRAEVAVDGGQSARTYARTILIGNCGRITGGIDLMPDAQVDDGLLDCVVLAPKGVAGWVLVSARLLTRNRKAQGDRLARHTGERFDIRTDQPEEVQLDGDVIGTARHVVATVSPRALVVRVGA
jgi:diacylglycerol kinase (ATP)